MEVWALPRNFWQYSCDMEMNGVSVRCVTQPTVAGPDPKISDARLVPGVLSAYVKAGDFPKDMAVNPDGRTLVVSNYASEQVEGVVLAGLSP